MTQSMKVHPAANSSPGGGPERVGRAQVSTVAFGCLVSVIEGYDLQAMAVGIPAIAESWGRSPSEFGFVLSVAFLGIAVGAALFGPLGDRWGRKPVIVASLVVFGLSTLGITLAGSIDGLAWWRFVVGIGLGACSPSLFALVSDALPRKSGPFFVTLMPCTMSLGAILASLVAPRVISEFDWHAIFVIGGGASLLASLAFHWGVRETRSLSERSGSQSSPWLRIPSSRMPVSFLGSIRVLLVAPYALATVLFWIVWTFNSLTFYTTTSWLPTVLRQSGMSMSNALSSSGLVYVGGSAGGLLIAWLLGHARRGGRAIVGAIGLTATVLLLSPIFYGSATGAYVVLIVLGVGVGGMQTVLPALGSAIYPSGILATGLSWASVIGRSGAIIGPAVGGIAIAASIPTPLMFAALALPTAITACCLAVLLGGIHRHAAAQLCVTAEGT